MPQAGRALKRAFLQVMPLSLRLAVARSFPNLRKSMPEGLTLTYDHYLGDVRVNVDTRYKVERIMWADAYERPLVALIRRTAKPDWIALDIGANVGAVSLALARFIGPAGHVHAFEPGPPNVQRLRANLGLNPTLASRVTVHAAGVGDVPGELHWQEETGNPGNAMLGTSGTHRVPVVTIDDFVRQQNLPRIDFIKVDVEGMELNVFRGALQSLRRFRPVLYFETLARYDGEHGSKNFALIESLLTQDARYTLHRVDREGVLHKVVGTGFADYTVAIPVESGV